MSTFIYEAMDSLGQPVKGTIDADWSDEAIDKIRAQGKFPTKVKIAKGTIKTDQPQIQGNPNKARIMRRLIAICVGFFFIGLLIGLSVGFFIGQCFA